MEAVDPIRLVVVKAMALHVVQEAFPLQLLRFGKLISFTVVLVDEMTMALLLAMVVVMAMAVIMVMAIFVGCPGCGYLYVWGYGCGHGYRHGCDCFLAAWL